MKKNYNCVDPKHNKATLKVTFMEIGNFKGKVQESLSTKEMIVVLFKETTSLKKDNKETYKYNAGLSVVGNKIE